MRFGRFEDGTRRYWGLVDRDAGTVAEVVRPFAEWAPVAPDGERIGPLGPARPLATVKLLAPYEPMGRVFGCGANFWEHLAKTGLFQEPPEFPVAYLKPDTAIIGHEDPIRYPSYASKLDYELELVAVVGRELDDPSRPSSCLLGYTVGNDVSVRDAPSSLGGLDLFTMKAADRMSPMGPWIVTPDEVGGAGQPELDMSLAVNGHERQRDNTRNHLFTIDQLLRWVNERNRLRPGDVIYTGSPAGTAFEGDVAELYLQPGDVVEAWIEGVGVLRNTVGAKEAGLQ